MQRPSRPSFLPARALPGLSGLVAATLLAACGGGGGGGDAGGGNGPPGVPPFDGTTYAQAGSAHLAAANELTATTHGSSVVNGATVAWTASAGHLTASDPTTGAPEASFFHVTYTADGADPATRPVTFFFNGGPGSSSTYLHLGSFAPSRIATGVPDNTYPRTMPYVTNTETLIDTSDLVFVDAVGTGYSEAITPFTNASFWGTDVDAAVMRDFIRRWLDAHGRTASPLYVFGESYGTVRAPLVARYLEDAGITVAGVVLQSSILDYNSNCGVTFPTSVPCTGFIPSYAAVGDWLGLVQPAPSDLGAFLDSVVAFSDTTYQPAAVTWLSSHTLPAQSVIDTLVADTGLPAPQWQARFNMDNNTFRHQIVPGSVAGLYDGRIVAPVGSPLDANDEPSDTLIDGAFVTRIGPVLAGIGYTNNSNYLLLNQGTLPAWNFKHGDLLLPDVVPDLAQAMTLNPALRVLSLNGVHDLITPFHQTELDLARMSTQAPRIAIRRYPGGHMTYLDDTGRVEEKADLQAYYNGTLARSQAAGALAGADERARTLALVREQARARARARAGASDAVAAAATAAPAAPSHASAFRDPGLPSLAARLGARTTPGESGAALDALVERRLKASFDAAAAAHGGRLTAAQARAAGLGWVAAHFDEIDAARAGSVSFDDWKRRLQQR